MTYYIDAEFNEGFFPNTFLGIRLPNWLSKRHHRIELISIGIVCEDGRTYSAISREYSWKNASKWVRDNVIIPLYTQTVHGDTRNHSNAKFFHKYWGKSNKQIAQDIFQFMNPDLGYHVSGYSNSELREGGRLHEHCEKHNVTIKDSHYVAQPTLVGYYSAYDHVLFCSLFGTMMDLPAGFPMYTHDLKQKFDRMVDFIYFQLSSHLTQKKLSFEEKLHYIKKHESYPKQTNEHNALADARWNQKLDKFLSKYDR